MNMTDQEYQEKSNRLFEARQSGKIPDEETHLRLQKKLDKMYRPDNEYDKVEEGKRKLTKALEENKINQEQFEKFSRKVDSKFNPSILDERSELITPTSRAMVKNLGFQDDRALKYLRKENPNVQFGFKDGEIIAKAPQDEQWKKLDPSSMEIEDISDVAYDVGSGIAEGSAGVLGSVAGPLGVIGASGAAAGGMEALRQGLGNLAGVSEEMDLGQIGTNAALSGVTAGLLGAGTAKGLLPKVAKPVMKPVIGAANKVKGNVAGALGSFVSKTPMKDLSYVRQNLDEISAAEKNLSSFADMFHGAQEKVMGARQEALDAAGRNISDIKADYSDIEIDLDDVDGPLKELIEKYTATFDRTNAGASLDNAVKVEKELGGLIRDRRKLQGPQDIDDYLAELNAKTQIYRDGVPSKNPVDTAIMNAAKRAAARVKELRDAQAPRLGTASDSYSDLRKTTDPLMKHFKDSPTTEKTLRKLGTGTNKGDIAEKDIIQKGLDAVGLDLSDVAYKADIYKRFVNPSKSIKSTGGGTSTSQTNALGDTVEGTSNIIGQLMGLPYTVYQGASKLARGTVNYIGSDHFLTQVMKGDKKAMDLLNKIGVSAMDFLDNTKRGEILKKISRRGAQSVTPESAWENLGLD